MHSFKRKGKEGEFATTTSFPPFVMLCYFVTCGHWLPPCGPLHGLPRDSLRGLNHFCKSVKYNLKSKWIKISLKIFNTCFKHVNLNANKEKKNLKAILDLT